MSARHKQMFRSMKLGVVLVACWLATGCWESTDVTYHEPGKYFGAADELKTDAAALQKRFASQLDR